MNLVYRPIEPQDNGRVAVIMAPLDVDECKALGYTPWQALAAAEKASAFSWTGEIDGWPEAMFGVVPGNYVTGLGHPWFLGSRKARFMRREFLRDAPEFLARIEALFPRLDGYVSARNTTAIRWLHRMGFVVQDETTLMRGEPMRRFLKGF